MELTLPVGTLTDELTADVETFYGDVFGFTPKRGRLFRPAKPDPPAA